jgi:hypothetical protein
MAELENRYGYDPLLRLFAALSTVLLIIIFAWAIAANNRAPSTRDRLQLLEEQTHFIICLLLIEPENRVPAAVADCQASASPIGE